MRVCVILIFFFCCCCCGLVVDSALRERLNKIMASDYFITSPEMKAPVEVAAGNYASFQVPITGPTQVEGSVAQFQHQV